MWPTVLRLGSFEISSFGVMMALAFLAAGMIVSRELARRGEDGEVGWELVMAAALGGIVGAKLYYAILYRDPGLLVSRAGLVWYGGLIGAMAVGSYWLRWRRIPFLVGCDSAAPGIAFAYAIGRIGCFLVGDDYGRPTDLPWGVKFPEGSPPSTAANLEHEFGVAVADGISPDTVLAVHPTQLYEAGASLVIFAILWGLRRRLPQRGFIFGLWVLLAALERFVVEFWRAKDDKFLGSLTLAQGISLALAIAGLAVLLSSFRRPSSPEGTADAKTATGV